VTPTPSFATRIRPFVSAELTRADKATRSGKPGDAFAHLEAAHVLGQASTREHVRVHWQMLVWGIERRDAREILGQIFRIIGAATKTVFGLVPTGNTGGANISPFKPLPVAPDLQEILESVSNSPNA
jgi:hypothetical protein